MPENFNLTMRLGNDAMQTPTDVARALREIADFIDGTQLSPYDSAILDENGDDVGVWEIA